MSAEACGKVCGGQSRAGALATNKKYKNALFLLPQMEVEFAAVNQRLLELQRGGAAALLRAESLEAALTEARGSGGGRK